MALFNFGKSAPTAQPQQPETPTAENTPAPEQPKDGLDKFSYLFDNDKKSNEPAPEDEDTFDPLAALQDDQAVEALLSKLDFRKAISETTQQKLANDDPNAMMDVINDIAKASYRTALLHNQTITQRVLQDYNKSLDKNVSSKISQSISDTELKRALPEISNPVVAAGIQPFVQQLKQHNPNMSPEEVVAEVRGYLQELNIKLNPPKPNEPEKRRGSEVDWLSELGLE